MGDYKNQRPGGGGGNKPPPAPGISAAEAAQLRSEVARLKKMVEEHLSEKNQWSSEVRSWVDSSVTVHLINGETVIGTLRWVDRYTMAIQTVRTEIVHKAAIIKLYKNA